jgi:hypothetical protein
MKSETVLPWRRGFSGELEQASDRQSSDDLQATKAKEKGRHSTATLVT